MASFNIILRHLRQQNKLTQIQLAQKLGLSYSAISMYERGQREPDFETLEAIADYFNVTMDYLHGKDPIVPVSKYDRYVCEPELPLPSTMRHNTIRIVGRDGSCEEKYLSDEQIDLIKRMIEQMPEFKD